MVERIEVVRGGGSALYGSSAIGGTVNIITRIPKENNYDFSTTLQSINSRAVDRVMTGSINMLTHKRNAGSAIFVSRRNRDAYDHNDDNFSELPELRNNSFGANIFFKPVHNQKLELNLSSLYEYRYGGEMIKDPAFLAQQSEERLHNILMGGLDYQINFHEENSSFIVYLAGQQNDRKHYTGVYPDDQSNISDHISKPPYGYTRNRTLQAGTQINHRFQNFFGGVHVMTVGAEYIYDNVFDTIPAYNFEVDQLTGNLGGFAQSDWKINSSLTFLSGIRIDKHNLVRNIIYSPRISLLYRLKNYTQFRITWGTGFRAPQAFDADMHIAFAGGGVSRISLSPSLKEERSNSISASVNYDKVSKLFIAGFTLEGFYTRLYDAFYLHPLGEDAFGELFEKRNGPGATVQGLTLDLRGNLNRHLQLEAGMTLQSNLYEEPVVLMEGLEPKREILRSPNEYAYATAFFTPGIHFNASLSGIFTGPMQLVHHAGAPEQTSDAYITSPSIIEINVRLGYTFVFESVNSGLEIFGGIKNLTNSYQNDFDTGKYRDSNYIYSQGTPRAIYIGIRLKSF
jgi:outer membrane receptor for ferrienterochelin and colicins